MTKRINKTALDAQPSSAFRPSTNPAAGIKPAAGFVDGLRAEANASALGLLFFCRQAAAAGAAPALNYFGSIFHYSAVFTQNLGKT